MRLQGRRAVAVAAAAVLLWGVAGLRRIDAEREFGVLDGALPGLPSRVDGSWALAPPGLVRLHRFVRGPFDAQLPRADVARVPAADGSRFGVRGTATLEYDPEQYLALVEAARGGSVPLVEASRAAALAFARAARGTVPLAASVLAFEANLREGLARRGVAVHRVRFTGLDWLETRPGETRPLADRKLLVVGLDGADWAILDPLLRAGRLPNLDALVRRGVRAKLLSISPMISPVVWTSIATGEEPARHGVLDFLVPAGRPRAGEPVTSDERRVPAVWELLSERGVPVGVTGWWASWPAPEVNGYVVSDRLAYQLFGFRADAERAAGKTWPADLYDAIRPLVVTPEAVPWEDVVHYLSGPRRAEDDYHPEERERIDGLRTLIASGRTYLESALEARRLRPPRFEAVYFEGTDTAGHLFMNFRAPRLPEADDAGFASFRDVVDRYYETADAYLGRLLEDRGADWTVMVLSDHGFATDETRPRASDSRIGHGAAADWHRRFGVLVVSGAGVLPGKALAEASIYDIAPTILALYGQPVPSSWRGRVLGEIFEPAFFERHPVVYAPDAPPERASAAAALEDPQAAETLEKLRSLGYIAAQPAREGEAAPASEPNNRGVALLAEGKFDEAAGAFREALKLTPDSPILLVNLGVALSLAGHDAEAARHLERAFLTPATRKPAGLRLAQMRLGAGDLDGAERLLRKVLEIEPGAADVHNTLGVVLERGEKSEAARAQFLEAVRLDADSAEPRNNLGNMARDAGRSAEAEAWYLKAIEADPYFMGAYNNLALVYQDRGEDARAIELYGRALEKSPRNAVVLNNLASLYFAAGEGDEARRLWTESAAIDPLYVSPLNNLAGLALTEKRYDEAERLLRQALELDPVYGDARVNLALVEQARGQVDAARRELVRAALDARVRRTALRQLGVLELGAGRPEAAREALESSRRDGHETPDVLNPLGEAYRRLGRTPEARKVWEESLRLDPSQNSVAAALQNLNKAE